MSSIEDPLIMKEENKNLAPKVYISTLKLLSEESRTMIFYESPHKLSKTLAHFSEFFGSNRLISVSRELTKLYEENRRGTIEDVLKHYLEYPPKGELVIVVSGKT